MKCATTSLHYYLDAHPEIQMSRIKELNYFVEHRNWRRGQSWYMSHFTGEFAVRGETSPVYTAHPLYPGVPERMHRVVPHARLIYIVRDPIERVLSEYLHRFTRRGEDHSLEEVLVKGYEGYQYLDRSRYYFQLEQYFPYFSPGAIHILTAEALGKSREQTMADVFRFLGVDEEFRSHRFYKIKHPTRPSRRLNPTGRRIVTFSERRLNRYQPDLQRALVSRMVLPFTSPIEVPALGSQLRARLADLLADDVRQLRAFSGKLFKEWSL